MLTAPFIGNGRCAASVSLLIRENADLIGESSRVLYRRHPRRAERCGKLMIVIRDALVCMPVDRGLKNPVVVVMVGMVELLMQGDREN